MNSKICNKCNNTLPATTYYFHVLQKGKYGLRAVCKKCMSENFKAQYIPIPKKIEKTCGKCKETFPLTNEYFFTKTTKAGTIIKGKALSADSTSFRHICKKCNNKQGQENHRNKLMIKYNVSSEKELDEVIHMIRTRSGLLGNYASICVAFKRRKYQYPLGTTKEEMVRLRRIYHKGYTPETYDTEWKKNWVKKAKASRKYNYPDGYDKVPKYLIQKAVSDNMTDAFIANRLGFKLEDVPVDVLELKKKQLKFYRDVKNKKNQNN
jgi:hypothetical protein